VQKGIPSMNTLLQDLAYALRLAFRFPVFTLIVVLTLGLGIGATTAVFTVVDAVLLRPVPYPEPDRIITVLGVRPERGPDRVSLTPADFISLREQNRTFSHLGSYVPFGSLDLTGDGEPVRLQRHMVSEGLLETLSIRAVVGRLFQTEEYRQVGQRVVILSHRLWQSRFGGDRGVVGRRLLLGGESYEVVGVLPPDFRVPGGDPDLLVPLAFRPEDATDRESGYLGGVGRLRPGVSLAQAQADLAAIARGLEEKFPDTNKGLSVDLVSLPESYGMQARTALWVIFGAVVLLLLITCVNVSNLQLVRALAREQELGLRVALGATAPRLLRQLLTENLLFSLLGGVLGLLIAKLALHFLPDPRGIYLPASLGVNVGARALQFTILVALATALVSGLVPALRTSFGKTASFGVRGGTAAPRSERLQSGLVVLEVALAFMLLIGAGLLVRSFLHLIDQDPGFEQDHVLTLDVSLPAASYGEPQQMQVFYRELIGRIAALPGVVAVGAAKEIPPAEPWTYQPLVEGEEVPEELSVGWQLITPGYLEALRTRIVAGEGFTARDRAGSRRVALFNESAVQAVLGGRSALGKRVDFNGDLYDVVGVIEDQRAPGREESPVIYFAYDQSTVPPGLMSALSLVIRTEGDPAALAGSVKSALWSLDRNLPIARLEPLERRLAAAAPVARSRFNALLMSVFSGLALVLAAIGIYGVLSYSVRQRTREIGLRMALGAGRADLLKLVLRRGLGLAVAGVFCGGLAALLLTRVLESLLVGISSADPLTFILISAALVLVAALACYLPARRASRLDPFTALRFE
jgi:putative ABC transport system permease protein